MRRNIFFSGFRWIWAMLIKFEMNCVHCECNRNSWYNRITVIHYLPLCYDTQQSADTVAAAATTVLQFYGSSVPRRAFVYYYILGIEYWAFDINTIDVYIIFGYFLDDIHMHKTNKSIEYFERKAIFLFLSGFFQNWWINTNRVKSKIYDKNTIPTIECVLYTYCAINEWMDKIIETKRIELWRKKP